MNIAIFGGSFNPPHVCHTLAATWVLAARPVDKVWLVPVGQHAFGKQLTAFEHRLEMTRLAMLPIASSTYISDVEHRLGGQNRTVDTLQHLDKEHPSHRFSLIIGADILQEAHAWKAWDVLENTYGFHILGRDGYPSPPAQDFKVTLPRVSSTDLRAKLAAGDLQGCLGHMNLDVLRYIAKHRLYNIPKHITPETIDTLAAS